MDLNMFFLELHDGIVFLFGDLLERNVANIFKKSHGRSHSAAYPRESPMKGDDIMAHALNKPSL